MSPEKVFFRKKEREPQPSKVAHVYAGQSSQFVGMGKDLFDTYDIVKDAYRTVEKATGIPIAQISFEGPEELLNQPVNTQLAILAYNEAYRRVAKELGLEGFQFDAAIIGGHSIAIYNAYIEGGVFTLEQAAPAVQERAKAMKEAAEKFPGKQVVLLGITESDRQTMELNKKITDPLEIGLSADNSTGQIVMGVPGKSLDEIKERAEAWLKKKGIKARTKFLEKSDKFHNIGMEWAVRLLTPVINALPMNNSNILIVKNTDAKPTKDKRQLRSELLNHLPRPVQWRLSIEEMRRLGITTIMEPGKGILINMMPEAKDSERLREISLGPNGKGSGIKILNLLPLPTATAI